MRTDNAADIRLNAMLGNCIFYISPMYEFSHSLDPKRTSQGRRSYLSESCPDVSATFTTIAFDDSSLRRLEIGT
jgi:hypothetical protein